MYKRISLLLILYGFTAMAQPYPVGRRALVFTDNSRGNRSIPAEIYYPGSSAGNDVPVAAGTTRFPVVAFGHGFLMPVSAYRWLADSLVKYGFIVAFPTTESGFSPSHEQFGRDLAFLCQRIPSLNDSAGSFLFGRVRDKTAVAGHSMGGGSSFLATTYSSAITALFNFAAAETTPSAQTAALSVQRPALVFSGGSDCITAPSMQLQMYSNIPYSCKTYISVNNALHCQFGNNESTCVLGQITSGCNSSSITAADLFQKTVFLLLPFLQYYLQGDCSAGQAFQNNYNNITGVVKQRSCTADPLGCVVTGTTNPPSSSGILLSATGGLAGTPVRIRSAPGLISSVALYDENGRLLAAVKGIASNEYSIAVRERGCFFLEVVAGRNRQTGKIIRW